MLAVADGHFGTQTSHALLERLRKHPIPSGASELERVMESIQEPELIVGAGSTLVVAIYDEGSKTGFGMSTGDSTLATVSAENFTIFNPDNSRFFLC